MLEQHENPTGFVGVIIWIINGLLTIVVTLGMFIMGIYRRKLEVLEKAHTEILESHKTFITREELKDYMESIAAERQRMHQENLDNGREIRGDINGLRTQLSNEIRGVHQRIDGHRGRT